jgi:spore coat polysaccharide biosynthesis predicted glycosyltransferase SpsG
LSTTDIELVCDGSHSIGYGHVRRTLTLAEALRRDGRRVRVRGMSHQAQSLLPSKIAQEDDAAVVVFDAPAGVDPWIRRARDAGQVVVALDWFGEVEPDVAIVVYPHHLVRARQRSYVGLEYQMIRAEITEQHRCLEGEGVVVMLGGGDVRGQGHLAAGHLANQGLRVSLIQGPLATDCEPKVQYEVLVDPHDLPARLASSAWVVTNGGSSMFEAMYLSKAVVALPQTDAEKILATFALERGALLGIGLKYLRRYDREELHPTALRAAALIDGRGAQRVAEIVGALA